MTTIKIFKQESTGIDKYKSTKQVDVVLNRTFTNIEHVQCGAFTVGPRGGYSSGFAVGFGITEWNAIQSLITELNTVLSTGVFRILTNVEKPWDVILSCTLCNDEIVDSLKIMSHLNANQHRQIVEMMKKSK